MGTLDLLLEMELNSSVSMPAYTDHLLASGHTGIRPGRWVQQHTGTRFHGWQCVHPILLLQRVR